MAGSSRNRFPTVAGTVTEATVGTNMDALVWAAAFAAEARLRFQCADDVLTAKDAAECAAAADAAVRLLAEVELP